MAAVALAMPLAHSTSVWAVFQARCNAAAEPWASSSVSPVNRAAPEPATNRELAPASSNRRTASSVAHTVMAWRAWNTRWAG
jgi:hypothetical protein